jgi:hypothetical protein
VSSYASRSGNMAFMAAMAMLVCILILFVLIPSGSVPFVQEPETSAAVDLADQIRGMPLVNDQGCPGMTTVVSNTLSILQSMNRAVGTNFGPFQLDPSQCDVVVQYVPIIGSYDDLVIAARQLNPNNSTSVKVFYERLFLLSSDFIIMNDSFAYNYAFKSTGELNDALGLARLRSVCGDECYSIVLSGIHWAIRDYMNQFLCQFEGWLATLSVVIPDPSC